MRFPFIASLTLLAACAGSAAKNDEPAPATPSPTTETAPNLPATETTPTVPSDDSDSTTLDRDDLAACTGRCGAIRSYGCITPEELASCRTACTTAKAGARNTFIACGDDCAEAKACYDTLTK